MTVSGTLPTQCDRTLRLSIRVRLQESFASIIMRDSIPILVEYPLDDSYFQVYYYKSFNFIDHSQLSLFRWTYIIWGVNCSLSDINFLYTISSSTGFFCKSMLREILRREVLACPFQCLRLLKSGILYACSCWWNCAAWEDLEQSSTAHDTWLASFRSDKHPYITKRSIEIENILTIVWFHRSKRQIPDSESEKTDDCAGKAKCHCYRHVRWHWNYQLMHRRGSVNLNLNLNSTTEYQNPLPPRWFFCDRVGPSDNNWEDRNGSTYPFSKIPGIVWCWSGGCRPKMHDLKKNPLISDR
jgi:hypothetical protein